MFSERHHFSSAGAEICAIVLLGTCSLWLFYFHDGPTFIFVPIVLR
jgi:hypothetical protein